MSLETARGRVRWHPPRAVLDLAELDLAELALAGALDPALALDHLPAGAAAAGAEGSVRAEDVEGGRVATYRARAGEIPDLVGVSTPHETPTDADLVLDTTGREVEDCLASIWELLRSRGHVPTTPNKRELR